MAIALVGSAGAELNTAGGASNTPSWGTGESRTAGNLLICICASNGSNTLPTTPTGWSVAAQVQDTTAHISLTIFYKVAAGADAAPTIAAATGTAWHTQLMEFSGVSASPLDQSGTASGTSGTDVATTGGADVAAGDLVIADAWVAYSVAATESVLTSLNNGATYITPSTNNNATSALYHYQWSYGFTTGNSAADAATVTYPTTNLVGSLVAVASFAPAGSATTYNQTAAASASATGAVTNQVGATRTATATSSAGVTRGIARTITAAVASTASAAVSKVRVVAAAAVASSTASVKRGIARTTTATATSGASVKRAVARTTLATVTSTATATVATTRAVLATALATSGATVKRGISTTLRASATTGATLRRGIAVTYQAAASATGAVTRGIAKTFTAQATSTAATTPTKTAPTAAPPAIAFNLTDGAVLLHVGGPLYEEL